MVFNWFRFRFGFGLAAAAIQNEGPGAHRPSRMRGQELDQSTQQPPTPPVASQIASTEVMKRYGA